MTPQNTERTATLCFGESATAERYERVLALLPGRAAALLANFVTESGNPDQAVLLMEVLLQRHGAEALAACEASAMALRACVGLFGASAWLGKTLLQNVDLLELFARPMGLIGARTEDEFGAGLEGFRRERPEMALPVVLARYKRREYVRIFVRELLGLASLAEIISEISGLTDVLIECALEQCAGELRERYVGWPEMAGGRPARFAVLALGKLGGNELNYSSDVDLLYLCDDSEEAGTIGAREFFTRLAQELTATLSEVGVDGPVFRVDLRLRPLGTSGEMVAGRAQALRYYRGVAEDWELQALLKLRVCAGDRELGREFVGAVQELIYRDELCLSAIQTAARSLEKIRRGAVQRRATGVDVKNGAGGLREIEFAVQCLQRVHGGGERWLRSSGTMFALQKLHDKGYVGDGEFRELFETYALLRAIEHRLQCRQGVQLHRLPEAEGEQRQLFRSLGDGGVENLEELRRRMRSASELCAQVLRLGEETGVEQESVRQVGLGAPGAEMLTREVAGRSEALAAVLAAPVGDRARRNLQRFLAAASTGEVRMRAAVESVVWMERALPVFARSTLGTEILARYPDDIVALFREVEGGRAGTAGDRLRIRARRGALRNVGRTVLEGTAVWEVLRRYSDGLDGIVRGAMEEIGAPAGFAVFAVGRLGTREVDLISDADLVFVRSAECEPERAEECARALVAMLTGYTREGSIIVVDTRLRPHGGEGELVASTRKLRQYFESEAKGWEAIAFGKMRWIAGDESLAGEVREALSALRRRFAKDAEFSRKLLAMRRRLEASGGELSFKTGAGALYDIDFLLGLLETRNGLEAAGMQGVARLERLMERGMLAAAEGGELRDALELFRRADHATRVVEGRSRRWLPESEGLRADVEAVAEYGGLDAALRERMRVVRPIFKSIFGD